MAVGHGGPLTERNEVHRRRAMQTVGGMCGQRALAACYDGAGWHTSVARNGAHRLGVNVMDPISGMGWRRSLAVCDGRELWSPLAAYNGAAHGRRPMAADDGAHRWHTIRPIGGMQWRRAPMHAIDELHRAESMSSSRYRDGVLSMGAFVRRR